MKLVKKTLALVLTLALVAALFAGLTLTASAADASAYPEATELAVAAGFLADGSWTDAISAEEAVAALQKLYDGAGFADAWTPEFSGAVTGADFCAQALKTIGWDYADTQVWIGYNHLEKALGSDYSADAELTREQAAQIILNVLKTNPTYDISKMKAAEFGLSLVLVGEDEVNRPIFRWEDASAVSMTEAYTDTPVAILSDGATWGDILDASGEVEGIPYDASYGVAMNGTGYGEESVISRAAMAGTAFDCWSGNASWTWEIEVYPTYYREGDINHYNICAFKKFICEIKTISGVKALGMYDPNPNKEPDSPWGWWCGEDYLDAQIYDLEDGFYIMTYTDPGRVFEITEVESETGTLESWTNTDVTYDGKTVPFSNSFDCGKTKLEDDNVGRALSFMLDKAGRVIGITVSHVYGEWTFFDASCHEAICEDCGLSKQENHVCQIQNAKAATEDEDGYTGDAVCTICGGVVREGDVIPKLAPAVEEAPAEQPAEEAAPADVAAPEEAPAEEEKSNTGLIIGGSCAGVAAAAAAVVVIAKKKKK